jgi:xanthine dehydrogenase accessory factor
MEVLIRGGGDLASGIALRLHRCELKLMITELPKPLVVRRKVSFAEAVYEQQVAVEDQSGFLIDSPAQRHQIWKQGGIPVLVDPELSCLRVVQPAVLVDARMRKKPPRRGRELAPLVIGLGPGFTAGENCHAAIETNRGHHLGRVIREGSPQEDTGVPGAVMGYDAERVLRAPAAGLLEPLVEIGERIDKDQPVCRVAGIPVRAAFDGFVRGLLRKGTPVEEGMKVGDIDPRDDPGYASVISDKARCLGGSVLEAILTRSDLREQLWS